MYDKKQSFTENKLIETTQLHKAASAVTNNQITVTNKY